MTEHELDRLLAKAQPITPSDDFMARLVQDAQRMQPKIRPQAVEVAVKKPSIWHKIFGAELFRGIGGAGVPVCLSLAVLGGVFLGYNDPVDYVSYYLVANHEGLEMIPAAEPFLFEG